MPETVTVVIPDRTKTVTVSAYATLSAFNGLLARVAALEAGGGGGSMSAAAILAALLTVDGTSSGLDADKLDGQQGNYYAAASDLTTLTSTVATLTTTVAGKQATITGAATTIASLDLTANRAVIANASGKVAVSSTTAAELAALSGVTVVNTGTLAGGTLTANFATANAGRSTLGTLTVTGTATLAALTVGTAGATDGVINLASGIAGEYASTIAAPNSPTANSQLIHPGADGTIATQEWAAGEFMPDLETSALLDEIGATQGAILYRGADGWYALSPGPAGQTLQTGGTGANPSWAASSGTKTIATFRATANEAPASSYATFDVRNSHPVLDFVAGEKAVFRTIIPDGADLSNGITFSAYFATTSATTGTVGWTISVERLADGGQDTDSDGFGAAQTITAVTVPATSGVIKVASVTVTQAQLPASLAAGDMIRICITRGTDTASGDAELHMLKLELP